MSTARLAARVAAKRERIQEPIDVQARLAEHSHRTTTPVYTTPTRLDPARAVEGPAAVPRAPRRDGGGLR